MKSIKDKMARWFAIILSAALVLSAAPVYCEQEELSPELVFVHRQYKTISRELLTLFKSRAQVAAWLVLSAEIRKLRIVEEQMLQAIKQANEKKNGDQKP